MSDESDYHRKPWMSDDQWFCAQLWADVMRGFHHCGEFKQCSRGIEVSEFASNFSTFDFDALTRIVLFAHDRCVRVELASSGPNRIKFALHRRHARDGSMMSRHPTIDEAIATHRKTWPEPVIASASAGKGV